MSRTGKGQVEFDDDLDNTAETAPSKGVMDFGDDTPGLPHIEI